MPLKKSNNQPKKFKYKNKRYTCGIGNVVQQRTISESGQKT